MEFINGKIHVSSTINKYVPFNIHNQYIGTTFSCGTLVSYSESGIKDIFSNNSHFATITINDGNIHSLKLESPIEYEFAGKILKTSYQIDGYLVVITSFIGTSSKEVCFDINVSSNDEKPFTVIYTFGANLKITFNPFKSNIPIKPIALEGATLCLTASKESINNKVSFIIVIDPTDSKLDATTIFNRNLKEANQFNDYLNKISDNNDIKKWALASCLSLYKNTPNFKGVFAGINYFSPGRTYYRDGYFTCLSFIKYEPDYVKDEIITLAYGITDNGKAPSAVAKDHIRWWENHVDSPLYFILLVKAYINETKDNSILEYVANNKTIKEHIITILKNVNTDDTGLIVKEPFDRKDWADNVYREGYVTYIECLYYGALMASSKLIDNKYENVALKVKESINTILWNPSTNAFYNFISNNYKEDNISIDTIFAIIYGVVDKNRASILLDTFEKTLESINNKDMKDDYGVMCVYPNYKYQNLLTEKSSYPFRYHNGANWPYLTSLYALCKKIYKKDYNYPIDSWIELSKKHNWTSPIEYYSPYYPEGSLMQGWSSDVVLVYDLNDFEVFR